MDLEQKIALAKYGYGRLLEVKTAYPGLIGDVTSQMNSAGYVSFGAHWAHRVTKSFKPRFGGMPHMAGLEACYTPAEIEAFIAVVVEQCETLKQRIQDLTDPKNTASLMKELADILKGGTNE